MAVSNRQIPWKQSRLVWSSFRYFSRSHLALMLGIAAATAVIIGALVVGDSVRGSLRSLVLNRLANVELLLQTRNFFDAKVVSSIAGAASATGTTLVPLIVLSNSSVEFQSVDKTARASHVQMLGIDQAFVDALDATNQVMMKTAPGPDEVVINQSLARELGLNVGDQITLLLSNAGGVPADNPLGRRDEVSRILPRQKVVHIVDDKSIGSIRFHTSQEVPFNVFASLQTIQEFLDVEGRVNASIAFSINPEDYPDGSPTKLAELLSGQLKPSLEDFGLQLDHHRMVYPDESVNEKSTVQPTTVFDYYQLSSKDLLIDKTTEYAVVKAIGEENCSLLLAYLVNSIQKAARPKRSEADMAGYGVGAMRGSGRYSSYVKSKSPILETVGRKVPYSIVVGVSSAGELQLPGLNELEYARSTYGIVNSWLAKELELSSDDQLQLEFYEPETVDGRPVKFYTSIRVSDIVDIAEPTTPYRRERRALFDTTPQPANDPNLTPSVPGITDQKSISNWDVPFELELRDLIQEQDDKYWENHRLTPKIFMPLMQAQQLFSSRFGNVTSIRIPAKNVEDETRLREKIQEGLLTVARRAGFEFIPVKQQQLLASSGTTPFDMLFLGLSFFVIVAAFLLVAILFRLGIQQRTTQLGILAAQGFSASKVRSVMLQEFLIVAALGSLIGVPLGLAYARLMIAGLESWWIGAISTNFLEFSFSLKSVLMGTLIGMSTSMLTIFFSLRRIAAQTPLSLLRGQDGDTFSLTARSAAGIVPSVAGVVFAVLLALFAFGQTGMARAGCFFGSGMLLLLSVWLGVRQLLLVQGGDWFGQSNLIALAFRSIRRNPLRSSLSIGLLAVASFLIASLGVFRMSPTRSGYGGFDLMGVSTQPIYDNMGSPLARREVLGPNEDHLQESVIMPLRMREGDDASCTNLFQAAQPTILGVSPSMQSLTDSAKGYEFSWAASSKPQAPWDELQLYGAGTNADPMPVILDQNTALWSLKQGGKIDSIIVLNIEGRQIHFRVVGLLSNSVLQGKLLISEHNFEVLFPKISGYRFFLISTGNRVSPVKVANVLEEGWSPSGLDVTSSQAVLGRLLGVQNTYISAFQALGALGLLLGTVGLVAVQLRSVLERRRELALMQAVGFSKVRIGKLLTLETAVLLGIGFLVGVGCAALALIPYVLEVGPQLSLIQPIVMLGAVFACGFVSAVLAIILALKLPLLSSLRTE